MLIQTTTKILKVLHFGKNLQEKLETYEKHTEWPPCYCFFLSLAIK